MSFNYGKDDKTALQAKFDAQKIAFAPIMFQASLALRNLGILDLVKKSRKGISIEDVAQKLNLSVYGVKVLLEAGLSLELVIVKDNLYFITKTGWFIVSDELTKVNMDFTQDVNYKGMFSLEDSIKTGEPTGLEVFGKWDTVYEALSELPSKAQDSWFAFDHFYSDYAFPEVLPVVFKNNPKKILDVGGNTGKFSLKCVEHNSDVNVTILDLPGQLKVAHENIDKHSQGSRVDSHPMNLLDHSKPFPKGYDIIWMSQFLDCFSKEDVLQLLKRAFNALDENGRLYILETYWDNQEFEASTYSLHATSLYFTNIANGCSQMYSTVDMKDLIKEAGLEIDDSVDTVGVSHTLYMCKKRNS